MSEDDVRITFRISAEKKERLENLIDIHNALVDNDEKITKSDLLRECVDESIDDLETRLQDEIDTLEDFIEGNPTTATATAD